MKTILNLTSLALVLFIGYKLLTHDDPAQLQQQARDAVASATKSLGIGGVEVAEPAAEPPAPPAAAETAAAPGLTESQRMDLFQKMFLLEDRADAEAGAKYPIDANADPKPNLDRYTKHREYLVNQYRKELAAEFGVDDEVLANVKSEGLVKNWPIPELADSSSPPRVDPPRPPSLTPQERNEKSADLKLQLAKHFLLTDPEKAKRFARECIELSPDSPAAREARAILSGPAAR